LDHEKTRAPLRIVAGMAFDSSAFEFVLVICPYLPGLGGGLRRPDRRIGKIVNPMAGG